jgi:hypothetical protein
MSEFGIPNADELAKAYFKRFAERLSEDPGAYFQSVADAAAITLASNNFSAALDVASDPLTRTSAKVLLKDEMRNACEALIRLYSIQIKYNQAISSEMKAYLGIAQPNSSRQQRNVPATFVDLAVKGALLGSHTVTYTDSMTGKKSKPFGAQTVELIVAISDEPVSDPGLGKTYGIFSRNPIGVAFEHADNTKVATYWARWANVRGQAGPWSNPVSLTIAA